MSAGHNHKAPAKIDNALLDSYYKRAKPLVENAKVVRTKTIPWLANRSRDGKTLYIDRDVPERLPKTDADTTLTLAWHELPEWLAMNDGLPYDKGSPSAHVDVATPLERREVERQGVDWKEYTREMDGYVKAVDSEKMDDVPREIDKRPFVDDKARKIIAELTKTFDGVRRMATKLRALKINEVSLVDRPANPGAKVLLAKRGEQMSEDEPYWKREFSADERRQAAESGAAESDGSFPIKNASDLKNAMRAIGRSKNPAKTKAHIRARAKALGLTSMLSDAFKSESMISKLLSLFVGPKVEEATAALGKSLESIVADPDAKDKPALVTETLKQFTDHLEGIIPAEIDKALSAGDALVTSEDDGMSPALKKALGLAETATEDEVLKAIAAKDAAVAKSALDVEIAKAGLSDDEKKHHDALASEDERKAFRALSKSDRAKAMAKRDDIPESVRKAVEENADLKKRLAVLEDERELAIHKRRAVELGLAESHGETLMKAKRGDATAVEALVKLLGDAHAALDASKAFSEFGTANGATGEAMDQLTAKAEEMRKRDPKLTQEQAFAKVYEDPANRKLVAEERRANRPAAA